MSEITKLLAAAGLLAAGFFGASLFGTPEAGDSTTGAPGDWTPQRLEPLGSDVLTQAPSTLDENVAPASHTGGNQFGLETASGYSAPAVVQHSAARPIWPSGESSSPPADSGAPEIRRVPSGERTASIAPPLFNAPTDATPMQNLRFPKKATDTASPSIQSQPPATAPTLPPQLQTSNSWSNDWGGPSKVRSVAPLGSDTVDDNVLVWHVVSDGDTLAKIAERYLGDAYRAREIYELNQDRLQNPDLLPIGVELRIPERQTGPSVISVYDSHGASAEQFAPQSRLVPLPELPDSVRRPPRARLQAPVGASLVGSPQAGSETTQ
ncbi:LysM peptidoglycan-binding domain-containing protein [Aeoliella sp.]|uniref:LysM peptidoglycan-binding domain-containing protein n=1 Tax=Aeoliella sp. TaxID=2795800 RepID=UPI003CCB863D